MNTIGAYDAKTHLPRLLDEVARGGTVTITKHGREVARLVPVAANAAPPEEVIAALRFARKGVRRGRSSVRQMVAKGRR